MNHSPDNFSSDSDWDGGDIAWNEHDWQQYLLKNEAETARFLQLYFDNITRDDRLDTVAHLMQWDRNDWLPNTDDGAATAQQSEPPAPDDDIYTVHRHPVYMVTRAFYQALGLWLGRHLTAHPQAGLAAHHLARSFENGQFDAGMGFCALDIGEYALAICHLKRALGHINASFGLLGEFEERLHPRARTLLFDLRELYLRVIADCREENRRRASGDGGEF